MISVPSAVISVALLGSTAPARWSVSQQPAAERDLGKALPIDVRVIYTVISHRTSSGGAREQKKSAGWRDAQGHTGHDDFADVGWRGCAWAHNRKGHRAHFRRRSGSRARISLPRFASA